MDNSYFDSDLLDMHDQSGSLIDDNFSGGYQSKRRQLDDLLEERRLRSELDDFEDY